MNDIFFIGDTHFGHKNIMQYEPEHRQFKTIEEHDEELIKRWNDRVGKKDIVWHLGDFCFGKEKLAIAERLNGKKRLILGNHDVYPISEYSKYFERIHGALFYKQYLLTHIPVHPNHARVIINVHGHLHSKNVVKDSSPTAPMYINVSAEQINLTPISLDELNIIAYQYDNK